MLVGFHKQRPSNISAKNWGDYLDLKNKKAEATSKGDKNDEKDENVKEDTKAGKLGKGDVRIKPYLEMSARNDLDKTKRQMNKKDDPKLSKDIFMV